MPNIIVEVPPMYVGLFVIAASEYSRVKVVTVAFFQYSSLIFWPHPAYPAPMFLQCSSSLKMGTCL